MSSEQPTVLIFDSGVGGLSIYRDVQRCLPAPHYLYVFDNAYFPYGEKAEAVIIERVTEIVRAIQALHPIDIAVIACNTASTISLPVLREQFQFPIVGVVPAIKPAAQQTRNGVVGLLATRATIQRLYTHQLIEQFAAGCHVELLGSAELVEIAEAKLHGGQVELEALSKVLAPWLSLETPPDTIVLGCTHFPLLEEELRQVLPADTLLIDSGDAVARRVASLLGGSKIAKITDNKKPLNQTYCTLWDSKVEKLLPILEKNGFSLLQLLDTDRRF